MNKNKLTTAVLTALVLASSSALAANEYPASDFQPKVVYSDSSATAPAAAPKAKAAEPVEADPNFPAANYQPKVLFNDADYKHTAAAPGVSSAKSAVSTDSAVEAVAAEPAASNNNTLFGLLAVAAVGFFLYKKNSCPKSAEKTAATVAVANEGATGVEKYLEKQGLNKTGVAKYLDKQSANPATGVAKYMAKQLVKDRSAAAAKTTGVERYLRDKG